MTLWNLWICCLTWQKRHWRCGWRFEVGRGSRWVQLNPTRAFKGREVVPPEVREGLLQRMQARHLSCSRRMWGLWGFTAHQEAGTSILQHMGPGSPTSGVTLQADCPRNLQVGTLPCPHLDFSLVGPRTGEPARPAGPPTTKHEIRHLHGSELLNVC